jgi:hypothetical protein
MFTPKTNSKQKRAKNIEERETGHAVRGLLAQRVNPLAIASYDWQLSGKLPFSPQNTNFDFPKPKFDPKVCLNISKHEKTLKIM